MQHIEFNQSLLDFIANSPTPFHAVNSISRRLKLNGFVELFESDDWQLEVGGKYWVERGGGSIVAWVQGELPTHLNGLRLLGAHTDSPCLKVKPNPEVVSHGMTQVGVEVYGGVLLGPWFDRDLSIAGRLTIRNDGKLESVLVDAKRPVAVIPSLAIHLDRQVNKGRALNPQKELLPLLCIDCEPEGLNLKPLLRSWLDGDYDDSLEVLDFDLSLYDTNRPALIGLNNEFIASARLDNLLSCFVGMEALIASQGPVTRVLVCNDHEEVGSRSAGGAQGSMLRDILERICGARDLMLRSMSKSMLISMDNAHALHPNYVDKHDPGHAPLLNGGPVVKVNANQSYASNSENQAIFRDICERLNIPIQSFVARADMMCGSTIGPMSAAELGISTLDVGVPTFAMHSIRELAGTTDAFALWQAARGFLDRVDLLAANR